MPAEPSDLPSWIGDLPSWVNAITTTAALIAAIVAARVAYKVYEIEARRDQQAEHDRRAREQGERGVQAAKVAAWYSVDHEGAALVRNASDLPIYDVRVFFFSFSGEMSLYEAVELREHRPFWRDAGLIPPGETAEVMPPDDFRFQSLTGVFVGVDFRDAAGNYWSRSDQCWLSELP